MYKRIPLEQRVPELARMHIAEPAEDPILSDDLEFAGSGGEHVVFRVRQKEGHEGAYRSIVVKANTHYLRRGVVRQAVERWDAAPFATQDDARLRRTADHLAQQEDDRALMQEELERERQFFHALGRFFSSEHILRMRSVIRDVPVTPKVAREILEEAKMPELVPSQTVEVPTIVRYQREIPKEADLHSSDSAHSLGFRYVERYNIDPAVYQRLNLMCADRMPFDEQLFARFLHHDLMELAVQAKVDEELKRVLSELVRNLTRFTSRTNEMLDLAGEGNARVYKDAQGRWTYVLMDVWAGEDWTDAHRASRESLKGRQRLEARTASTLLNAVNYTRLVNGLAIMLGIKDRLELFLSSDLADPELSRSLLYLLRKPNDWPDKIIFPQSTPAEEERTQNVSDSVHTQATQREQDS